MTKLVVDDETTGVRFTLKYDPDKPLPLSLIMDNPNWGDMLNVRYKGKPSRMNGSCYESVYNIIQGMITGKPNKTGHQFSMSEGLGHIKGICEFAERIYNDDPVSAKESGYR